MLRARRPRITPGEPTTRRVGVATSMEGDEGLTACMQVNHDNFHRMLDEYREAKRRELDLELKAKQ